METHVMTTIQLKKRCAYKGRIYLQQLQHNDGRQYPS